MQSAKFSLWRWRTATRIFAVILTGSFTLSPLGPAFAQEFTSDVPTDPGTSSSPIDTPPTPDFSIPGVPEGQVAVPPDTASSDANSDQAQPSTLTDSDVPVDAPSTPESQLPEEPQQQSLLSSPGSDGGPTVPIPGIFTSQFAHTDALTGAFTQKIPLDIPPGRNGLQPDLSLQYHSQRTDDSIVGYGWTLSIPYIQALNKTGSQDLHGAYGVSRYFTSSIDGELATTSTATSSTEFYGAKVDGGNFNAYRFSNDIWTMYDKGGTRYTFGASTDAQVNISASSTQIYKWMLTEIKDTNNNLIRYIYTRKIANKYTRRKSSTRVTTPATPVSSPCPSRSKVAPTPSTRSHQDLK